MGLGGDSKFVKSLLVGKKGRYSVVFTILVLKTQAVDSCICDPLYVLRSVLLILMEAYVLLRLPYFKSMLCVPFRILSHAFPYYSIRVIFYDVGPCVSTCSSARFQRLSRPSFFWWICALGFTPPGYRQMRVHKRLRSPSQRIP